MVPNIRIIGLNINTKRQLQLCLGTLIRQAY